MNIKLLNFLFYEMKYPVFFIYNIEHNLMTDWKIRTKIQILKLKSNYIKIIQNFD